MTQVQSSGMLVNDECRETYDSLNLKKAYPYIIYEIKDNKEIRVQSTGNQGDTYNNFVEALLNIKEPRYAVVDVNFRLGQKDEEKQHAQQEDVKLGNGKLAFISWNPDDGGNIKKKMIYASSQKALVDKLNFASVMQANDTGDLAVSALYDHLYKNK